MRLAGKVAIITGAGSGIGRGIALRFAQEGAAVLCADINEEGARETAEMVQREGGKAAHMRVDVANREQVEAMVAKATAQFGRLDITVANAGIYAPQPFLEMTDGTWDRTQDINAKGVFLCCQAAAQEMLRAGRGGKIITIASVYAEVTGPGAAAYSASKGAVRMLTHTMALELASYKINVNCIAPGLIDTPMLRQAAPDEATQQQFLQLIPWGRLGQPADIANATLFLASEEADYITGETLFVDGGWLIK